MQHPYVILDGRGIGISVMFPEKESLFPAREKVLLYDIGM
jgi:hypothetical protein